MEARAARLDLPPRSVLRRPVRGTEIDFFVNLSKRKIDFDGFEAKDGVEAGYCGEHPAAVPFAQEALDVGFILRDEHVFAQARQATIVLKFFTTVVGFGSSRENFDKERGIRRGILLGVSESHRLAED